ncbi:RNA polymerase III-inhibiting protein maf1 [Mayamaea pseudoterrestris]|nr:RNA polymerase III-inhibiting protein maf1 [Mayamaea pseudoterrestris]
MKYLQVDALTELTARLQEFRTGQRHIQGRIEAFTMKRAGNDKKYAADLKHQYVEQQETFESDWKQLLAASSVGKIFDNAGEEDLQRLKQQQQQQQQQKRGRSQSVGICQDLGKLTSRAKHPRSSSFDLPLATRQYELPQQITSLGDLRDLSTRRLMTDLILTLNMSFPDYDFSNVQPNDFQSVSLQDVMQAVYSQLSPILCSTNESDVTCSATSVAIPGGAREGGLEDSQALLIVDLWNALDEHMQLKECEIYSWNNADMASEELWLWSFHYLFVNKALKRIVLFTCSESMQAHLPQSEDDDDEGEGAVDDEPQVVSGSRQLSADLESEDANFDLDPSAAQAGGFSLRGPDSDKFTRDSPC